MTSEQNIPNIQDADKYEDITLLTCKNYAKQSKGMICTPSDLKFESLSTDEYFPCSLISLQGAFL